MTNQYIYCIYICTGWWFGTFFSRYWDFHHPNWRPHIFQRGRSTTNQIWMLHLLGQDSELVGNSSKIDWKRLSDCWKWDIKCVMRRLDSYPMTDPWCWYINANIKGVYWWDPWHTIYSSTMDPMGMCLIFFSTMWGPQDISWFRFAPGTIVFCVP